MDMTVNTSKGLVRGFSKDGIGRWFGIPYAQPPVGDLRFRRARESESWIGVCDCTVMAPKPLQFSSGKFDKFIKTDNTASEDCLYLNVWAPDDDPQKKKPVMFWIYGGENCAGDASAPEYDMSAFARDDIVGVSFNYRLGVLGFYNFSHLDKTFESNCAVSDMIMALKWVHDNISEFGGDPDNVTIAGHSSGGTAVTALLGAPSVRSYFKRAVIMSGMPGVITAEKTHKINRKIFYKTLDLDKYQIAKLRGMKYEEFAKGVSVIFDGETNGHPGVLTSGPVIDDLVPEDPVEVLERGDLSDKEIMIGTCRDEGALFHFLKMGPRSWDEFVEMFHLNGYMNYEKKLKDLYAKMKEKDALKKGIRDRMIFADSVKLALAASKHNKTFMYRFDYVTPICRLMNLGAAHSMDICPAFDTYTGQMSLFYSRMKKAELEDIHNLIHGAFVRFITSGDPSSADEGVEWMPFDERKMLTYIFDRESYPECEPDKEYYDFWKDIELYKEV